MVRNTAYDLLHSLIFYIILQGIQNWIYFEKILVNVKGRENIGLDKNKYTVSFI